MGDLVVYRIDVATPRILQVYSGKDAHHIFGDEDLPRVDADDDAFVAAVTRRQLPVNEETAEVVLARR